MKTIYSNSNLIDSLNKNYQIQQSVKSSKYIYLSIGLAIGAAGVLMIYSHYHKKQMEEIAGNLRKQVQINDALYSQLENISKYSSNEPVAATTEMDKQPELK